MATNSTGSDSSLTQILERVSTTMNASVVESAAIQKDAVDHALWQMQQANAMAKIKSIYTLAKTANEMT